MLNVKYSSPIAPYELNLFNHPLTSALFNDAPDAIFILSSNNYQILDCNSKALEIFEAESKSSLIHLSSFRLYESEPIEFSRNLQETNIKNVGEHTQELAFRTLKQNIFWGKLRKRSLVFDKTEYTILRIAKVVDYLRAEEALSSLLRGTAKHTGKKFFKELSILLCRSFDVKFSFIGKLSTDKKNIQILEFSGPFNEKELIEFKVQGTMIENVMRGYTTFYPGGVKDLFPNDILVKNNNIDGFMGTPVFGNSGEVIGLLVFMHDRPIQEIPNSRYILSIFASRTAAELQRMRSKEILKEQTRSLADANTIKDMLLSVVSHDLIDPLNSVMGYSKLLRDKIDQYDREKIIEKTELVDNSIRNIYVFLENISDWSRIYMNKTHFHSENFSVREIINGSLSLLKYIIDIKNLKVTMSINGSDVVNTDRHMLNSILRNLLSSAVRYTPKGGSIQLETLEKGKNMEIQILDSGTGIPEKELKIINDENLVVPDISIVSNNASSLGMVLSKNFASRIGANLKAESDPDMGTKVKVIIPYLA